MARAPFQFELYRLAIADEEPDLFRQETEPLRTDAEILRVLQEAAGKGYDYDVATERTEYRWGLRAFTERGPTVTLQIGKSIRSTIAPTMTDRGIEESRSEFDPPTADFVHLVFLMPRHLVAVEYRSAVTGTEAWRAAFTEMVAKAAHELGFGSRIELEPVPGKDEIMREFRSFEKLTKLKLVLRLPNPEISRHAQDLYERMLNGGIREFAQKMYNPRGLSQAEGQLPHAAAELAAAGYKDGAVQLEGVRDGKRRAVKTGRKAARGSIDMPRDVARGMLANAKSKEAKKCLEQLIEEMDKVSPPPPKPKAKTRKKEPNK